MNTAYNTGFLLNRASWCMTRKINQLLTMRELKEVHVGFIGVLFSLYKKDGRNITDLGEEIALEKSTMTGLIDRMERAGLIKRAKDPGDRRAYRIVLTQRAKKIKADMVEVVNEAYKHLNRGISKKDGATAVAVLEKIILNSGESE